MYSYDPCLCDFDEKNQTGIIWIFSIPIIVLFQALNIFGVVNIYRFCKSRGFTRSLFFIYMFSFSEQIALSFFLAFIQEPTEYNYFQYAIYLYSKLLLGISYQISVFELKFTIQHFFQETPYQDYVKKRRIVKIIMNIWRLVLAIFLGFDFYFHAFRYFQYDKSAFSITSYSFMATNFVALVILLLWET